MRITKCLALGGVIATLVAPISHGQTAQQLADVVPTDDNLSSGITFGPKATPTPFGDLEFGQGGLVVLGNPLGAWDPRARPIDPVDGAVEIRKAAEKRAVQCKLMGGKACDDVKALEASAAKFEMSPFVDTCSSAFKGYIGLTQPSLMPQQSYDIACLESLVTRAVVSPSPLPPILANNSGGQSLLAAIGVLKVEGKPFCTALLRPDRTLITALHCYGDTAEKWATGKVTVTSVAGGPDWPVGKAALSQVNLTSKLVADDWASFKVETSDVIMAPAVQLTTADPGAELFTLGFYFNYSWTAYTPAQAGKIATMVRWPKSGSCIAVKNVDRCLRMVCQTTRGFSGAPIFLVPNSPDDPVKIVGIISGGANEVEAKLGGCGEEAKSVTLASVPQL